MIDPDRYLELDQKATEERITPLESAELRAIERQLARNRFTTCPVCGCGIPDSDVQVDSFSCPNCHNSLSMFGADRLPHQPYEIHPALDGSQLLGEYVGQFIPAGCSGCFCGEFYPSSYTCCPRLLALAVELSLIKSYAHANTILNFLNNNHETLINCLRGRFISLFDLADLRHVSAKLDSRIRDEFVLAIIDRMEMEMYG